MAYPYVPARWHGGPQSTVTRIVMHSTVTPCQDGWARRVAAMFHTSSRVASAHFVVDPGEIIRCLPDTTVGYHAPPNTGSIGVELCDWSRGDQWPGDNHVAMLRRAAGLAADLAAKHDVPIRHVGPADLRAGRHGLCGHIDVTNAWHQTTHTDPAAFPWGVFLDLVHQAASDKPKPKPSTDGHPYPGHILKPGTSDRANTRLVQAELNRRADAAPRLVVDGAYGTKTETRVRGFQHHHHLAVDGTVGTATWKALFR